MKNPTRLLMLLLAIISIAFLSIPRAKAEPIRVSHQLMLTARSGELLTFPSTTLTLAQITVPAVPDPAPAAAPTVLGVSAQNLISMGTAILVPIILLGVKKLLPNIPGWVIPILAPMLGMLTDLVNTLATGHQSNVLLAALLGLAGVGLREVKDQIKPAVNGGWPTTV